MYCILLKDDSLLRILCFPAYFETLLFRTVLTFQHLFFDLDIHIEI